MPLVIQQGSKLEFHPDAVALQAAQDFYQLSYDGGAKYKNGHDSDGAPVFIPHEQESDTGVARRKKARCLQELLQASHKQVQLPRLYQPNSTRYGEHSLLEVVQECGYEWE